MPTSARPWLPERALLRHCWKTRTSEERTLRCGLPSQQRCERELQRCDRNRCEVRTRHLQLYQGATLLNSQFTWIRTCVTSSYITRTFLVQTSRDENLTALAALNLDDSDFSDAQLVERVHCGRARQRGLHSGRPSRCETFVPEATTRTDNLIWPDHEIRGLELVAGETLTVRGTDLVAPGGRDVVTVASKLIIGDGATLQLGSQLFEGDQGSFVSTPNVSIGSNIPIELGGTLLVSGALPEIGETLDLFDWPEPLAPDNLFSRIELPPNTVWDVSQLYTTGEITLVPEPANPTLVVIALGTLAFCCRALPLPHTGTSR